MSMYCFRGSYLVVLMHIKKKDLCKHYSVNEEVLYFIWGSGCKQKERFLSFSN